MKRSIGNRDAAALLSRWITFLFFFFNDTATTEIYTLSYTTLFRSQDFLDAFEIGRDDFEHVAVVAGDVRSEEHTSELQSQSNLVCRLLLEKKKKRILGYGRDTWQTKRSWKKGHSAVRMACRTSVHS